MRHLLALCLVAYTTAAALQLPNFQPFISAFVPILDEFNSLAQGNSTEHELLKRQSSGCPSGWNNCASLGAGGLCCAPNARCTADAANHLACCASSATCTGTIGGYITSGTVDSNGNQVGGSATAATTTGTTTSTGTTAATMTTTTGGFVVASTTTTTTQNTGSTANGFIIASGATVASPGTGSAARGVEIPLAVRILLRMFEPFL